MGHHHRAEGADEGRRAAVIHERIVVGLRVLVVVVAMQPAWLVLDETISSRALLGAVILLGSVAAVVTANARAQPSGGGRR